MEVTAVNVSFWFFFIKFLKVFQRGTSVSWGCVTTLNRVSFLKFCLKGLCFGQLVWENTMYDCSSDIFLKKFNLHFGAVAENHTASLHFFRWETLKEIFQVPLCDLNCCSVVRNKYHAILKKGKGAGSSIKLHYKWRWGTENVSKGKVELVQRQIVSDINTDNKRLFVL